MRSQVQQNRSIELFCGTGGLALGLQKAGFHHTALYEWDKDSCDNIRANIQAGYKGIESWNVHQADVRAVCYNGLSGKINMVSGGPPCQPFSMGGKAQAYNDKRDMFPEAVRAVREIMPEVFIFENVKGLLRKSFSLYFSYIILQLTYPSIQKPAGMTWEEHRELLEKHHTSSSHDDCEYNVVFRLLNAADYGVPQLRHRVVIVGFRKDQNVNEFTYPTPTDTTKTFADIKEKNTVSAKYYLSTQYVKTLVAHKERHAAKGNGFGYEIIPDNGVANAIVVGGMGRERNLVIDNRLEDFTPVTNIKGEINRDGLRRMTPREWARLQGFPDNFIIGVADASAYKQFGNSVAVPAIQATAQEIIKRINLSKSKKYGTDRK